MSTAEEKLPQKSPGSEEIDKYEQTAAFGKLAQGQNEGENQEWKKEKAIDSLELDTGMILAFSKDDDVQDVGEPTNNNPGGVVSSNLISPTFGQTTQKRADAKLAKIQHEVIN